MAQDTWLDRTVSQAKIHIKRKVFQNFIFLFEETAERSAVVKDELNVFSSSNPKDSSLKKLQQLLR